MITTSEQVAFRCRYCAKETVKHHRQRCLGRVDTCDTFDNQLYILKTGYWLETSFPVTILTSLFNLLIIYLSSSYLSYILVYKPSRV